MLTFILKNCLFSEKKFIDAAIISFNHSCFCHWIKWYL